ncbi:AmmeMemoRadiSam system protein A [Candidatus Shapirobacteria bacterium]|nr:AmmeMemoRadiSam system protein A [Candidatus Shapirobacteria bacterium]
MDPYIRLAKEVIETYIKTGKAASLPKNLPKEMFEKRAGVFVSLHLNDGSLRGCIGTFLPIRSNIAEEIMQNAISSATSDPRFPPVSKEELDSLVYSVDILSPSTPLEASELSSLDPKKYGLIVSTDDGRKGLLLPDIPGVESAEEQFQICCRKGGISPGEKVSLEVFTVERHEEKAK